MARHVFIIAFASIAMQATSATAVAATLGAKSETDDLSCTLASGRTLSVCGGIHDEPRAADWLQFRLGRARHLEVAWPQDRRPSLAKFEGNVFGPSAVSDLRFVMDDVSCGVSLSRGGGDDRGGGRTSKT